MKLATALRCGVALVIIATCELASERLALAQGPSTAAVLQAFEDSTTRLVEQAENSVVAISRLSNRGDVRRPPGKNVFGPGDPNEQAMQSNNPLKSDFLPTEFGSGVIVAPKDRPNERFVLTAYHVVRGGRTYRDADAAPQHRLFVHLPRSRTVEATIYAADPRCDLAVLKLGGVDRVVETSLPPLRLFDGESVKKGQIVYSLGNPYALARDGSVSVSFGIISNIARMPFAVLRNDKTTIHHLGTLLQVDTRQNIGTSGGALLNRSGELIGITTSLAALEGYESSAGFAMPINHTTRRVVESLLSGFEVEYGFLGVVLETVDLDPTHAGLRSVVRVGHCLPGSPGELGGLKSGDTILAVNNRPVPSRDDLMREIGLAGPGTQVSLQLLGSKSVNVLLGKWPVQDAEGIVIANDRYPAWRGLKVDWPTARQEHTDTTFSSRYPEGVLVLAVEPGSAAEAASLKVGQLITEIGGKSVRTPDQFADVVKTLKSDVLIKLIDKKVLTIR